MPKRDFENIRKVRGRLNAVKDGALVNLSINSLPSVKNILRASDALAQTAAYHIVAQKYENLDATIQRLNESMQFSDESKGDLKRDWGALKAADADNLRGALFALLSSCESLDGGDIVKRVKSESENLGKIMDNVEKIKNNGPIAKLSNEFELSLRTLDSILGGTAYPASESDAYSKFCGDLEDLGERVARLSESLRFLGDKGTRGDWKYFIGQDSERVKESMKTAYDSSMRLVDVVK